MEQLEQSIKKWEAIEALESPLTAGKGPCPLCLSFLDSIRQCPGCPLSEVNYCLQPNSVYAQFGAVIRTMTKEQIADPAGLPIMGIVSEMVSNLKKCR